MLVLSRKVDEVVVFYDEAGVEIGRLTLIDIRGDKVRIGCSFPLKVHIVRGEVEFLPRESEPAGASL